MPPDDPSTRSLQTITSADPPPVNRDPASLQIEAEIAATRERVAQSVMALEREITRAVDWREWIRRRPGRVLGLAFAVGWLFGRKH